MVDLAGEPAAMAGRMLADLGAEVILAEPPDGHPLRALPDRWSAWARGQAVRRWSRALTTPHSGRCSRRARTS